MGVFTVTLQTPEPAAMEIRNVLGSLIRRSMFRGGEARIDLSAQSKGIYFIRITDSRGNSANRQVTRQ